MSLWVSLLGMDEVGEFGGVTDKENGSIVKNPVEVAFV
jgi:hypothetical protein